MMFGKPTTLPRPGEALAGRSSRPFSVGTTHAVLRTPLEGPVPDGYEVAVFGLGCFWGAERIFWQTPGVYSTAVGYAGGQTPNPTYEEACSGKTGHTEAVRVVFDPSAVTYDQLLKTFWENHDPTQGFRQGNDRGTQYRSAIYASTPDQLSAAEASRASYDATLKRVGYAAITTEILPATEFWVAEDYHQQYLYKNPGGYCGIGGTGVACQIGTGAQA